MPAHGNHAIPFVPKVYSHDLALPQTMSITQQQATKSASDLTYHEAALKVQQHASTNTSATGKTAEETIPLPNAPPNQNPLRDVLTPLRRPHFEEELRNYPDPIWAKELLNNIDNGVSLGYEGPRCQRISRNLASSFQHPQVIDKEIQKELELKRILGPFDQPPVPNLQCSGVGVVPKKTGGWRMIMHLSAPPGQSINDGINKEDFTLRYSRIDDAIRLIHLAGSGALLAKIDLKSAFRIIPIRYDDRELLGIYWKRKFYIDRCLPFGLRSAPYIFNQFAHALEWILHNNYSILKILHYLDDFLLVGRPASDECPQAMTTMLEVCSKLGFPIAPEKLEGPAQVITFLGIIIDTKLMQLRLPEDKLSALMNLLKVWQTSHTKVSKRKLLSLIGKLSFAAKVVPAGRLFLRRLIDLSTKAKKLHHYIHLSASARADIQWWLDFLPDWNGVSLMLQPNWESAMDFNLTTDASGTIGYGAYFNGSWIMGAWTDQHLQQSIQWKELFAILAATATWGHQWTGKKILFHCDNQAVVKAWHSKAPKNHKLATLFRKLFFLAAKNNFHICLKHIPGLNNEIADALSRNQMQRFRKLAPIAEENPTIIPAWLTEL